MNTITYSVTRYESRTVDGERDSYLAERLDGLTVDQAEAFIRQHAGQSDKVLAAATIGDRMLDDVYQEMGATIYAQPYCIGTLRRNASPERIGDAIATLRSIEPQYAENVAYATREG